MDRRFDEVTQAIVEQREYTDSAYDRLAAALARMDDRLTNGQRMLASGLGRVERKLDQFIETQTKTNALMERRINELERTVWPS